MAERAVGMSICGEGLAGVSRNYHEETRVPNW